MRIYKQNRLGIVTMPRDIWVTKSGEAYSIVETSGSYLGEYADLERAQEVLKELFNYYRDGKKSYVMPEV